jgi:flagellum-specific peptidoglycan hydrolase FlgJ
MPDNTDLQTRLLQIAAIAVAIEKDTQCPAQLMIAQWAVESRWGAKPVGKANYFGMKKNSRDPLSVTVETEEVVDGKREEKLLQFADYDSLEESARDYAVLITQGDPYREAWSRYLQDRNLATLIAAVAARYASDGDYAMLVSTIAHQSNVARAIGTAQTILAQADPAANQEAPNVG